MIASQNGHVDVVNVLLQHGASVHLQNKVKLYLLHKIVSDIYHLLDLVGEHISVLRISH